MQEALISDFIPLPEEFHLVHCNATEETLTIEVISTLPQVCCPLCGHAAERVHSRYLRSIADLPCADRRVILHQLVRKFLCQNHQCERKIFSEQYCELVQPCAHKTNRLQVALEALGVATSGEVAARLAPKLGMSVSAPTVLRHVKALPCSVGQYVRVLDIDDWCWKRGQRYGTILVNLETHTVIDLLPDRETERVKQWLETHPEVELVSRDRGGTYADGAARGAKQARQVADRWHLTKNLGDAVEKYLVRQRIHIPPVPQAEIKEIPTPFKTLLTNVRNTGMVK